MIAPQPDLLQHRADRLDRPVRRHLPQFGEQLEQDGHAHAVVHGFAAYAVAAAEFGQLADEGHRVSDLDAQGGDLGRTRRADVDIEVGGRYRSRLLRPGLEVSGLGANDAEVAVDPHAPAQKERVSGAAETVEAQEAGRLDALDDEADLVEVRTQHQARAFVATAPDCRDIAVAIDVHLVREAGHALLEVRDQRLLESGDAVQSNQVAQGRAQAFLGVRRLAHRSFLNSRRVAAARGLRARRHAP
jgi:hypothetical protein